MLINVFKLRLIIDRLIIYKEVVELKIIVIFIKSFERENIKLFKY